MMIMLATALSIFAVAVREKKGAGTTAASMQAFAVADSGSEAALNAIFKNPDSSIGEIYSCTDGIATIPDLVGGSVQLTFYSDEESANIIPCNGPELLGDARKVKSVGRYGGTARAVEVAVAQTYKPVGTCYSEDDQLFIRFANDNDCGGWNQCTETDILTAMRRGCMPDIGQYGSGAINGSGVSGCLASGRFLESIFGGGGTFTAGWNLGSMGCSVYEPKACCKLGP